MADNPYFTIIFILFASAAAAAAARDVEYNFPIEMSSFDRISVNDMVSHR